ncbi:MAG: hypothetical protein ACM3ZQ_01535, partial [Bacillota bacterium]
MPDDSQRPILGMLMNPKTADLILNTVLGAERNPTIEAALRAKPELHQLLRYAAEGFNYLIDAAEQAGIAAYYFVLRDVDPEQRTVYAWVRELGQWVRRPVPWPDVFYDQSKQVSMGRETQALHAFYATSIPINSVRTLGK